MKRLLSITILASLCVPAMADIQDPPMNDYGPTRKLSRGLSNMAFGATELVYQPAMINEREGNASAFSYGIIKGFGRFFARFGYGVFETVTFPFPVVRSSYRVPYKSDVPWIHGGMDEFPPELGFESRYKYCRIKGSYP
jgi:putative exosortase-associated protein (TIGR04073 family)